MEKPQHSTGRGPDEGHGNLLGLRGMPAHFICNPPSWPWDITVIDIHLLRLRLDMPADDYSTILRLLYDLSDAMLRDSWVGNDLSSVLERTNDTSESRKKLARRIEGLPPKERLRCCIRSKVDCQVVDGRALLVDPWDTEKLWFSDDPVGWIRNGLVAIDLNVLPSLSPTTGSPRAGLLPCPAFAIQPCEITDDWKITTATVPALNIGGYSANTEIAKWRAGFWMRDIADGYALGGKQIQAAWLQQIPGASEPDPLYRFLNSPSIELRSEVLRFLRQVDSKGGCSEEGGRGGIPTAADGKNKQERGSWAHKDKPPVEETWWWGPLEGSLKVLSEATGKTRPTLQKMNADGTLWIRRVHGKLYRLWFREKAEYDVASKRIPQRHKET